jgi:hypothetical protein
MKLHRTIFTVAVLHSLSVVSYAAAVTRDSVNIRISGQSRALRLVSDDAQVEYHDWSGDRPSGASLVGEFRLEMVRPDGSLCGKLGLGGMSFDHGDGWDRRKVLILGDYNGDGNHWEVCFEGMGGTSNGKFLSIAGYDGKTGKLVRYMFRRDGDTSDAIFSSRYPAAVAFRGGYLRVRYYSNAHGEWLADLLSYDSGSRVFRLVRTIRDQRPEPWPEWPFM